MWVEFSLEDLVEEEAEFEIISKIEQSLTKSKILEHECFTCDELFIQLL